MRKSGLLLVSVVSAVLLACGVAWAAAGDLDPSFGGGDGMVASRASGGSCFVDDLAVLPGSDKIVTSGDYCNRLNRYNADGSPDETFGGDGGITYGYSSSDAPLSDGGVPITSMDSFAFVAQPDGGLVVGGYVDTGNENPQFILIRFLSDGTLDQTFGGGDGAVAIAFGERTTEEVRALAMQGDNIVAVGEAYSRETGGGLALARFLPDGTPDQTFGGGDGKTLVDLRTSDPRDLAVLPDGRLMVAGSYDVQIGSWPDTRYEDDLALARFRPDGTPDKSFGGGDGEVTTGVAKGTYEFGTSLAVKGSRAVVAGTTKVTNNRTPKDDGPLRFALAAYGEDGKLARSFGGDGTVKTVFGVGDAIAWDVVAQEDGKLLVVGQRNKNLKGWRAIDFAVARYNANGTLDKTFGGGDGKIVTDVSPGVDDAAKAVSIDEDGRAVVGGRAYIPNFSTNQYDSASGLARYLLE